MRIIGELKVYKDYTCKSCGRIEEGTYVRIKIDTVSKDNLISQIDAVPTPGNFPVEWVGYVQEDPRATPLVKPCPEPLKVNSIFIQEKIMKLIMI